MSFPAVHICAREGASVRIYILRIKVRYIVLTDAPLSAATSNVLLSIYVCCYNFVNGLKKKFS